MKLKDKVLVVEDEQNISNFISTVLTANDFDVLMAQTGAEAISMITSHCPDLIILDLGLPDMDGMNILKEVIMMQVENEIGMLESADHCRFGTHARERQGHGTRFRCGRLHRKAVRHE